MIAIFVIISIGAAWLGLYYLALAVETKHLVDWIGAATLLLIISGLAAAASFAGAIK